MMTPVSALRRLVAGVAAAAGLTSCNSPTDAASSRTMHPQSVVLLVTPKMIPDFAQPDAAVARFFEHYRPLTSHAVEVIVIFAVGNSDHILHYQGPQDWARNVEWARTTEFIPVSERMLSYNQIHGIVRAFRSGAASAGIKLKVYDQIDSGGEFVPTNAFKYVLHPECTANKWFMFDVGARMRADDHPYATAPGGCHGGQAVRRVARRPGVTIHARRRIRRHALR